VFTEPLPKIWFYNPVVPPLLSADDMENIASSFDACWIVLTELLPGNALIEPVAIYINKRQAMCVHSVCNFGHLLAF
jgi:hypothetical protein